MLTELIDKKSVEGDTLPGILQLGPFMIRMDWVVLAVSGFAGYAAMQWKCKRSDIHDRSFLEPLVNALLIIFFVWKMSPILLSPSLLREHPLLWLTIPGTDIGWWFGLAVVAFYLYRSWREIGVPWRLVGDMLSFGTIVAVLVHNLLSWQYGMPTSLPWGISIENPEFKYHPVNIYRLIITLPMLLWLWRNALLMGTGKWLLNTLTYYGMGLMVVTFFDTKTEFIFSFSGEQTVYLLMMLLGVGLSVFLRKESRQATQVKKEEREEKQNDAAGILPSDTRNVASDPIGPEKSREEERTFL